VPSVPVRRQASPLLFSKDDNAPRQDPAGNDDGGIDIDIDEPDDDWIVDDLGDGMADKPAKDYGETREMGRDIDNLYADRVAH